MKEVSIYLDLHGVKDEDVIKIYKAFTNFVMEQKELCTEEPDIRISTSNDFRSFNYNPMFQPQPMFSPINQYSGYPDNIHIEKDTTPPVVRASRKLDEAAKRHDEAYGTVDLPNPLKLEGEMPTEFKFANVSFGTESQEPKAELINKELNTESKKSNHYSSPIDILADVMTNNNNGNNSEENYTGNIKGM